jgi:hypothetical protein
MASERKSKNFSEEEIQVLLQIIDHFKPAGAYQWEYCSNLVNLSIEAAGLQNCKSRFEKEVPEIVKEASRIKGVIEEHVCC